MDGASFDENPQLSGGGLQNTTGLLHMPLNYTINSRYCRIQSDETVCLGISCTKLWMDTMDSARKPTYMSQISVKGTEVPSCTGTNFVLYRYGSHLGWSRWHTDTKVLC